MGAMSSIPKIVHFVFGLRVQLQPFHLLHYLAIESCRRVVQPDAIHLHYDHLPWGVYWDRIRPHLELHRVKPAEEVAAVSYDDERVPRQYRYAHHADFVRLDALIEHGGIYADIDTLFLNPLPDALFRYPFVIGREGDQVDELTGERKPSLCNAFLMSEPQAEFARAWRARMPEALNGTWNNHSCLLPQVLSAELPDAIHIEPVASFYSVPLSVAGLRALLEGGELTLDRAYSIHLWEHVWWHEDRSDFSAVHAGDLTLDFLRASEIPLAQLARPYLPDVDTDDLRELPQA